MEVVATQHHNDASHVRSLLAVLTEQSSLLRQANSTDIEKTRNLDNVLEHLRVVAAERSFYRSIVGDCSSLLHPQ